MPLDLPKEVNETVATKPFIGINIRNSKDSNREQCGLELEVT